MNARQAGGALAAVLPWRPPALTTRTMKEVNWGEQEDIFGTILRVQHTLKNSSCKNKKLVKGINGDRDR